MEPDVFHPLISQHGFSVQRGVVVFWGPDFDGRVSCLLNQLPPDVLLELRAVCLSGDDLFTAWRCLPTEWLERALCSGVTVAGKAWRVRLWPQQLVRDSQGITWVRDADVRGESHTPSARVGG